MQSNILVFAKRSLNLSKIQTGVGLGLASFGIFVIFALSLLAGSSSAAVFLISVSFMTFGLLMFTLPVTLLYVYDKNNGVLEYLLSLGWNQSDVFNQYLKAALFLAVILFTGEGAAILIAGAIAGSTAVFLLDLLMLFLTAFLGFSVVSLVTVAMMAFSSLQKQRVGANTASRDGDWRPFYFSDFLSFFYWIYPRAYSCPVTLRLGRRTISGVAFAVEQAY